MTYKFQVPACFRAGLERLSAVLGFTEGEGISVSAEPASFDGVSLHDGRAVIYYTKKHQFFRQLGILTERAAQGDFDHRDDGHFTEVSVMLDASYTGVPTVKTVQRMLDRLALLGYNMAMLYTEDTAIKLQSRPHFGYMRGAYSKEELRAMDDYADDYGIELVPCLECYAHMAKYLRWGEASDIKDTAEVLLAREEKTFAFLEELLTEVTSCFRSKRVHIGMDEAWDMGRGNFLTKHGLVPRFEIFTEYMERLISITDRLGLCPMMWSDMYFRVCSNTNSYYSKSIEIPPEVAQRIPNNVELVFWHYGEQPHCDDYMLKKHKVLHREVIYAGGLWSWTGHFPEHYYMKETVDFSLQACRSNEVHRAMITVWDYGTGDLFANLYGLSYFAERCYDPDMTEQTHARRFAATCGGNADAFLLMSLYHNKLQELEFPHFSDRFFGMPLFYQDLMEGLFDENLRRQPMSEHYATCAERMQAYQGGEWAYLYDFAKKIFSYLALKTRVHETLVPAYRGGDRDTLRTIAEESIPALKEMLIQIHDAHRNKWHRDLKPFSFRNLEDQYAGMESRCDTAQMLLRAYLAGETETLPQLEEPRLYQSLSGFYRFPSLVMS